MKRYITIVVAIIALHTTANAQTPNGVGAQVFIHDFEYQADSVRIEIDFNFENLKIGANESAVFKPTISKGESTLQLPTVVVERRGGARSHDRAVVLDNARSLAAYEQWYGETYQIIDYFGSQKQSDVKYSLTIPYQSWMVNSELFIGCSTCGCCTSDDNGVLAPDDNALIIDIPTVEIYQPKPLVELVKPEKVAIKRREVQYSAALIFKVNSMYIDPNLESNRTELESIDEMMQSVMSDSDYTITGVNIIGHASPEGRLETNMKLSEGRATALEHLMMRKYRGIKPALYSVRFGGENWSELANIVRHSDLSYRDEVLHIIEDIPIEDGRERQLMALNGGAPYRYLLKHIFPSTRLVEVDVEYNVDAYDLDRIGELIDTKPQNLSLEEMYRLSETYQVDDAEFEKIFITAVTIYPDDEVAQNNALALEIRQGNIASIQDVAQHVDQETQLAELANSLGAYYMLMADYDSAKLMLERAVALGSQRAEENMSQLTLKLENLQQIAQAEEFRVKIYGE